jgi:hypothetical protein
MAYPGQAAGGAGKQIILGIGLLFCEILTYFTVRPILVLIISSIVNPYQSQLSGLSPLAVQVGNYTEVAWGLIVLATVIVFVLLPASHREPSQFGY